MSTASTACPVCERVWVRHRLALEGFATLYDESYYAWLHQACGLCGMALGLHQIYLHPHHTTSQEQWCPAFESGVQR